MPPEIYENGKKQAVSRTFWLVNSRTPFFAQKYFTRYTPEMFFEEYINFKIVHNLSHCGVIPVQSFGSHIRPQSHGLGLILTYICSKKFWKLSVLYISTLIVFKKKKKISRDSTTAEFIVTM
jgi:hypothetical protein